MKCRKKVRNAYLRRYKMLVRGGEPYKLDRKMQIIQHLIDQVNTVLWSYVLIVLLIGCAIFFTIRTRFVQFRMIGEMVRLLGDAVPRGKKGETKHISSFQAFMVSLASRIGTGNLAGVATAITLGGPGAVFWMWLIALLGSASAFVESTLAQLYKRKAKDSFIGGPAYYMLHGLGQRWMGILFAVLISLTFGLAFNSVQSNTICAAWEKAFGLNTVWVGVALTVLTLLIIFGGIQRIAKVSEAVVPIMAIGYLLLAVGVILFNLNRLPGVLLSIVEGAFGWRQALGGGAGAAIMQGIKRGLFSNEAGEGSAPNVAATAYVTHPVKQGLIQALGVFTDTLVICSCTAFIILVSGVSTTTSLNGIQLTQEALDKEVGPIGNVFIAITIFLFAFSSVIGNYYYGEANVRFITKNKHVLNIYRILVGWMVMWGALMTLDFAWCMADLMMALMTACNLAAILLLSHQAVWLLNDYREQKRRGIKSPIFSKEKMPEIADRLESW
jgi:AGCS family alanine or glycine:cation symporter